MLFVAGLLAVCAAAQVAVILAPTAGTIATVGAATTLLALATNVRLFRRFAAGTGRARVAWFFAGLASSGWTLACLLYVLDVVATGVPSVHIACIAIAIVLLSRSRLGGTTAVTVLTGGFAVFAGATLAYLWLGRHGWSWYVHSLPAGYGTASGLLHFAGRFHMPAVGEEPAVALGWRGALPYVPVAGAFAVAAAAYRTGAVDGVMLSALLLVAGLVLVRQYLVLRTNAQLLAEVNRQRAELAHQATHDDLTGLPNRALLYATLPSLQGGLVLLDLDGFKQVNDTLGHPAGDRVLVEAAGALRAAVRAGDLPARLGGDEFAVLLADVRDEREAVAVADRIIAGIVARVASSGCPVRVGASAGVVVRTPGLDDETMFRLADAALYRSKAAGKGRVELHVAA
ncbi:GGDEF domain-containing protein [Dactylosporangium sp. NPDC049742]|uniref:GGDEF domain-containing protein n=1 Tax=Dactylosporangium sp. NPDC049742 TaxID=3154737 RepID=UPI0034192FE4